MSEEEKAERKRRGAKSSFTRYENSLKNHLVSERTLKEVRDVMENFTASFDKVVLAHENYCEFLADADYAAQEKWMGELHVRYDTACCMARDYIAKILETEEKEMEEHENEITRKVTGGVAELIKDFVGECKVSSKTTNKESTAHVQTEKIPRPKFDGKIENYLLFRRDWQHIVETRHGRTSDSLYLLTQSLSSDSLLWIQGILDYDMAWEALDEQYGNPRFTSDYLLGEIEKLKVLQGEADPKFGTLFHLVSKARNVLEQLDMKGDLDNSTTLGMIERKLTYNDRLKWAEVQRKDKIRPSVDSFLDWMRDQLWLRKIANADIRGGKKGAVGGLVGTLGVEEGVLDPEEGGPTDPMPDPYVGLVRTPYCWHCGSQGHYVDSCTKFMALNPDQRLAEANKSRACYFCLRRHPPPCRVRKTRCPLTTNSSPCQFSHHQLLHGANFRRPRPPQNQNPVKEENPGQNAADNVGQGGSCAVLENENVPQSSDNDTEGTNASCRMNRNQAKLLPIVPARCRNPARPETKTRTGNLLIDSGSELTLIRTGFADRLGLEGVATDLKLTVASGDKVGLKTHLYSLEILGIENGPYVVKAFGIPKITEEIKNAEKMLVAQKFGLDGKTLERKSGPVDLLIGIDHIEFHAGETKIRDGHGYRETIIGPVLFGTDIETMDSQGRVNIAREEEVSEFSLEKFWTVESMGVLLENRENESTSPTHKYRKRLSHRDQMLVDELRRTARKIENQWKMKLPLKKDPWKFPDNYFQVEKKLLSLEKRLLKCPELAQMYDKQIQDLVSAGSAVILTEQEIQEYTGPVVYMSHHAVWRLDKLSHPCRVVFNLAAPILGHILNEYLHQCGDHLNDLLGVLLRWRENLVAVIGDVSKMYHQVLVEEEDAHLHRFLWRNLDQSRKPDIYMKKVLTFGNVAAPAVANVALDMTAEENLAEFPAASGIILNGRYMDDLAESFPDEATAVLRIEEIEKVLHTGHFKVKGWHSNKPLPSCGEPEGKEKVLGAIWQKQADKIAVNVALPKELSFEMSLTKRLALSWMSCAFDVFGIGAPVVIRGKILMQEIWAKKYGWDEFLASELNQKWLLWLEDLQKLPEVEIDRCITPPTAVGKPQLVTFCDSSKLAYGAVSYSRWMLDDGTYEVKFLLAKSRVAPLKQITLARLELQSAVVATRLVNVVEKQMRLDFEKRYYLSDSMIALGWIRDENRTEPVFVANRTGEIQRSSNIGDWHHVRSEQNSADCITRGLRSEELSIRFLPGPDFLTLPEEQWGITSAASVEIEMTEIENSANVIVTAPRVQLEIEGLRKLGTLLKLKRVMAIVILYATKSKAAINPLRKANRGPPAGNTRSKTHVQMATGAAKPKEMKLDGGQLEEAMIRLLQMAQSFLEADYVRAYSRLTPFEDLAGLIRVGGRVGNANVKYDQKHPILIPYEHWLAKIIVEDVHKFGHPGIAATAARVRAKYWIIGVKRIAKTVVFKCVFCREMKAKVEEQFMADLPNYRLAPTPPFYHCACDLFGPYSIKISRNKSQKHWVVLFTCMATRALHGDIVSDYSATQFLQMFRRFTAIRGCPKTVLSDNGSQLVSAAKQIEEWCTNREINWFFTCPTAAHQNGVSESLVKSVKNALKFTMKSTTNLYVLEFQTLIYEAVNIVNERPIGLLPNDPNDGSYICPNDILLGRSGLCVPEGPFDNTADTRKRFEFVQRLVKSFAEKWQRDVFPTLVPRKKWATEKRDVRVGDLVLLSDPAPVNGKWTRGRIIEVYPGLDSKIRNVKVKTAVNEYNRPITKISVLLPVEEQRVFARVTRASPVRTALQSSLPISAYHSCAAPVVNDFKRFLNDAELSRFRIHSNREKILQYPLTVYHLTKRLAEDWPLELWKLEVYGYSFMKEMEIVKIIEDFHKAKTKNNKLPSVEDLNGVIRGIRRVTELYSLNLTDLEHENYPLPANEVSGLRRRIRELPRDDILTQNATLEKKYEKLCSQDYVVNYLSHSCLYHYKHVPYYGIKIEVMNRDPLILVFHDVVGQLEIDEIIARAAEKLDVSKVKPPEGKRKDVLRDDGFVGEVNEQIRVSMGGWLVPYDVHAVRRLYQRVSYWTGLNLRTTERAAENLQVANYGIGGLYRLHHDFLHKEGDEKPKIMKEIGDRMATFLLYLSEVPLGGATVFPKLNIRVPATMGSALFWFNQKADITGDRRTVHAGCPVAIGSKWIANIWTRTNGQMFKKKCPKTWKPKRSTPENEPIR